MGDTHIHIHNHSAGSDIAVKASDAEEMEQLAKALKTGDIGKYPVIKAEEERRYTLGIAYPALRADKAVAADGHIDYCSPSPLEAAAWSWMTKHREVGISHQDGTAGRGTVVESYIWRADPWVIKAADGTQQTVNPGDWLVGVQWREDTWSLIKSGVLKGYSPQGAARRRAPSGDDIAKLRT